ncbi:MAG: flagellar hook-length control protein FliK [Pseudomonadota bacterium]
MHAMNLSASLLPSRPDGPAQAAVTVAEDANLMALFADALGPLVPYDQQALQPVRVLTVDTAAPLVSALPPAQSPPALPLLSNVGDQQIGLSVAALPAGDPVRTAVSPSALPPVVPHTVEHKPLTAMAQAGPKAQLTPVASADPQTTSVSTPTLSFSADDAALSVESRSGDAPKQNFQAVLLPQHEQNAFPLAKFPASNTALPALTIGPEVANTSTAPVVTDLLSAPITVSSDASLPSSGSDVVRTLTPSQTPLEPQTMAQIRDTIRAGTRTGTIEVQLDPPELGRVLIELEVGRQGQVKAVISASESDTLDLMRRNGDTLAGDLKDSGFDDVELDWQQSEQSNSDDPAARTIWQVNKAPSIADIDAITRRHDGALDIQL